MKTKLVIGAIGGLFIITHIGFVITLLGFVGFWLALVLIPIAVFIGLCFLGAP